MNTSGRRHRSGSSVCCAAVAARFRRAQVDPQAIQRMVATERAFAAATARDRRAGRIPHVLRRRCGQIDHAAGRTSISRAKDALIRRPLPKLPLSGTLLWEPFTGQIADDGTMGWLTGATPASTRPVGR